MGVLNAQPSDIAHSAARPIAQRKKGFTTPVIFPLHQIPQDVTLIGSELARRQLRLRRQRHAAGGIAAQQILPLFFLVRVFFAPLRPLKAPESVKPVKTRLGNYVP